jgi:hypothetical protein
LKSILFLNTVLDRNLVFDMKVTFMEERKCPYVLCHCYWLHRNTWAMYHCWSVYLFHFTNVWISFLWILHTYYARHWKKHYIFVKAEHVFTKSILLQCITDMKLLNI